MTTTAICCVLFHGSVLGREIVDKTDDIETGGGARSLKILASDTDYCTILLVFDE